MSEKHPLPCGTPAAYKRHISRGQKVDEKCTAAYADACRANRIRTGRNQGLNVPVSLVALLVSSAPIEVRHRAVRELGPRTVSAVMRAVGRDGH